MKREVAFPWVVLALILVLAAGTALRLEGIRRAEPRLPGWDEAEHGVGGVALADALRDGDPARFLSRLSGMSLWPPVFPLLETPVYLLFGYGYAVPRAFVIVLFALSVLLLFLGGAEVEERRGAVTGAVASALASASPEFLRMALRVLLEVPVTFLSLFLLLLYLRYLRTGGARLWRAVSLLMLVLFFCKYNYGLLWIAPILLHEAARIPARRTAVREAVLGFFRRGGHRKPLFVFLAVYLAFLAVLVLSGGWALSIGGKRITMYSAGNPTYLLILILLGLFVSRPRRNWESLRRAHAKLAPPFRTFATFVALPIFLWFLVPSHVKNAFNFLENRSPGPGLLSSENILYYGRAFVREYSATPLLGIVTLLAAASGAVILARSGPRGRIVALLLLVGVVAPIAHPLKKARYFVNAAVLIWLAAGAAAGAALDLATRRGKGPWRETASIALAAILAGAVLSGFPRERVALPFQRETVSPADLSVLDRIAEIAAESNGTVVLGSWDRLSPGLLEWHTMLREPGVRSEQVPIDAHKALRTHEAVPLLDRLASSPRIETTVALELPPEAPSYRTFFDDENDWLPAVRARLAGDPRFRAVEEKTYAESGYRLLVYRRASD